jgi:hypothetical protein
MNCISRWLYAITFVIGAAQAAQAQVITNEAIDRNLSYRGSMADGYESPSQRYSYKTGAFVYICGDARQLAYLDYLDRADRAQKFGYRMPIDPYFPSAFPVVETNPEPAPEARGAVSGGGLFGFFRRR